MNLPKLKLLRRAEEVIKEEIFTVDEIYNLYREFDAQLLSPNICVKCHIEFSCLDSETGECESCFEANQMPQEIFEWWLVSPWLGKKYCWKMNLSLIIVMVFGGVGVLLDRLFKWMMSLEKFMMTLWDIQDKYGFVGNVGTWTICAHYPIF